MDAAKSSYCRQNSKCESQFMSLPMSEDLAQDYQRIEQNGVVEETESSDKTSGIATEILKNSNSAGTVCTYGYFDISRERLSETSMTEEELYEKFRESRKRSGENEKNCGIRGAINSAVNWGKGLFPSKTESIADNKKAKTVVNNIGSGEWINPSKRTTGPNLSDDCFIETLEGSLNYFGFPTLLQELQKSLENVKRNKTSKEELRQSIKMADKKMLKLSLTFHPDRVCSRGASDAEKAAAEKTQSALNATRNVLKIITEVFLEATDIDYKYEYFAKLRINSLVSEQEVDRRIGDVLFKISELSEIKRMNIIGEIRNFLVECQKCLKSYLQRYKNDFQKYRDFALYHLRKCIEGYEKLEAECDALEEECREESEENMRSVIRKVAEQSSRESMILSMLASAAKSSLEGNFQIFTTQESLDDYLILPFVYYVNVVLMCNVMLEKKRKALWFFQNYSDADPYFEKEPSLFLRAYYLASYFKDRKQFVKEVEFIMRKEEYAISKEDVNKKFDEALREIIAVLEKEFRIDAYEKGESNRMQLREKLLRLKAEFADLQEKEKSLRENISKCKQENEELSEKCLYFTKQNENLEKEMLEGVKPNKSASEQLSKLLSNYKQNMFENRGMYQHENHETFGGNYPSKKEKIEKCFEDDKNVREQLSDLLLRCRQNMSANGRMFQNENQENKFAKDTDAEMEHKVEESLEQNSKS